MSDPASCVFLPPQTASRASFFLGCASDGGPSNPIHNPIIGMASIDRMCTLARWLTDPMHASIATSKHRQGGSEGSRCLGGRRVVGYCHTVRHRIHHPTSPSARHHTHLRTHHHNPAPPHLPPVPAASRSSLVGGRQSMLPPSSRVRRPLVTAIITLAATVLATAALAAAGKLHR